MDGWNTGFLLGWPIFRGELLVSGQTVSLTMQSSQMVMITVMITFTDNGPLGELLDTQHDTILEAGTVSIFQGPIILWYPFVRFRGRYSCISWIYTPPRMQSSQMKVFVLGIPEPKTVGIPDGDCYWVGGRSNGYQKLPDFTEATFSKPSFLVSIRQISRV